MAVHMSILYHSGSQRWRCASHESTNGPVPSKASEISKPSSISFFFLVLSSSSTGELSTSQSQGSPKWAKSSQRMSSETFRTSKESFIAVRRTTRSRFAKGKFTQLRTKFADLFQVRWTPRSRFVQLRMCLRVRCYKLAAVENKPSLNWFIFKEAGGG